MSAIEGKVAKVLNKRELVITVGSEIGVERGMTFTVYDDLGDIVEPDTGEVLGRLKRDKIIVKASEIHQKFSIASTLSTVVVTGSDALQGGLLPSAFANLFLPRREEIIFESLEVNSTALALDPLDESDSWVKIGDPVTQTDNSAPQIIENDTAQTSTLNSVGQ